jgi:hypothetical protein
MNDVAVGEDEEAVAEIGIRIQGSHRTRAASGAERGDQREATRDSKKVWELGHRKLLLAPLSVL